MIGSKQHASRRLIPWLVGTGDLRRYLGRALDRCEQGGVVLFYHKIRSGPSQGLRGLLCLAPAIDGGDAIATALIDFRQGRFRQVRLSRLPRKTGSRTKGRVPPSRNPR